MLAIGASLTLSYAPFSIWPIMPIGLSLACYFCLHSSSPFTNGFAFGLGWFGAGISWVHVSIADFGGLPLVGSIGLMVLLCAYLSLYPGLFFGILQRYIPPSFWLLIGPFLWFLIEWLRGWVLTGFPWLSVGYSQIQSPLAGWMPVLGETGVSALLIALALSIAMGARSRNWQAPLAITATLFIAGWALNSVHWVTPSSSTTSVAMVQGNIKQDIRWNPQHEQPTMQKYLKMTQAHWHNDIIIWPEAAIPRLESAAESFLLDLDQQAFATNTGLVTGIVNYNFDSRQAFNNLLMLGKVKPDSVGPEYQYLHTNRYDKHHLLPVGEFIPFERWLRALAPIFDLPMSSFTRGDFVQPNLLANGYHLLPAICFEIAFPQQISANLTEQSDFIVTVSNDAWFGASHGPDQHLEIARVRAKEFGLPVLRATNTGITAFIDHQGNIQARLPQFEAGVLSGEIHRTTGKTPYRIYGDTIMWLLGLMVTVVFTARRFRR